MTQEVLKLAFEALDNLLYWDNGKPEYDEAREAITAIKEALREHAMREVQRLGQEIEQEPVADAYTFAEMRFVVCHNCGNKRCPKANDHRNACTNSNEVGQKGSSWEHVKPLAQPEQEPVAWINVEERKLEWAKPMSWNTPTTVNIPKIPLYPHPSQLEERNFCPRCGKRTKDIHTCTPPRDTQPIYGIKGGLAHYAQNKENT